MTKKGWIIGAPGEREFLKSLGIVVGAARGNLNVVRSVDYLVSNVSDEALLRLEPYWGRFIWKLEDENNLA